MSDTRQIGWNAEQRDYFGMMLFSNEKELGGATLDARGAWEALREEEREAWRVRAIDEIHAHQALSPVERKNASSNFAEVPMPPSDRAPAQPETEESVCVSGLLYRIGDYVECWHDTMRGRRVLHGTILSIEIHVREATPPYAIYTVRSPESGRVQHVGVEHIILIDHVSEVDDE